jgi:hypothetical protein
VKTVSRAYSFRITGHPLEEEEKDNKSSVSLYVHEVGQQEGTTGGDNRRGQQEGTTGGDNRRGQQEDNRRGQQEGTTGGDNRRTTGGQQEGTTGGDNRRGQQEGTTGGDNRRTTVTNSIGKERERTGELTP